VLKFNIKTNQGSSSETIIAFEGHQIMMLWPFLRVPF